MLFSFFFELVCFIEASLGMLLMVFIAGTLLEALERREIRSFMLGTADCQWGLNLNP